MKKVLGLTTKLPDAPTLQQMIAMAQRQGRTLVRFASCRKCTAEASRLKARCGYCNLLFEYLVMAEPVVESHGSLDHRN